MAACAVDEAAAGDASQDVAPCVVGDKKQPRGWEEDCVSYQRSPIELAKHTMTNITTTAPDSLTSCRGCACFGKHDFCDCDNRVYGNVRSGTRFCALVNEVQRSWSSGIAAVHGVSPAGSEPAPLASHSFPRHPRRCPCLRPPSPSPSAPVTLVCFEQVWSDKAVAGKSKHAIPLYPVLMFNEHITKSERRERVR